LDTLLRRAPLVSWSNFGDLLAPSVSFCNQAFAIARRKHIGNACGFQARLGEPQRDAASLGTRIRSHRQRHTGQYRAKTERQYNESNEDFEQRETALAVASDVHSGGLQPLHRVNRGSPVSQLTAIRADRPSSVNATSPPDDWPSG
jgi:hypothetical protein